MSEFHEPADLAPVDQHTPVSETPADAPAVTAPETDAPAGGVPQAVEASEVAVPVNPVRAAAGRLGAKRRQQLIQFGRQYEEEHGLTPGRQRLRQLVQLGKRYEQEHGLAAPKPRRKRRGDAWAEFLTALARVVKPAYRPAVEALVAALSNGAADPGAAKTAA